MKYQKIHIGIFGKTNVGKSSFLNKITNQDVSIVSPISGTTTDVVEKNMELLPIGSVKFLDSAGLDDVSELGSARIEKTEKILTRSDIAVLICDYNGLNDYDFNIMKKFETFSIPFIIVVNKEDEQIIEPEKLLQIKNITQNVITTSAINDLNLICKFKDMLLNILPEDYITEQKIVADLIPPESTVVLVTPIDKQAPKGRLILPQVQTIRDLLDDDNIVTVVKETQLNAALNNLKTSPFIVITDSQAFKKADEIVDKSIFLTSFSILFARLKGDLRTFMQGAAIIDKLEDGDKVLILESCSHHAIEDDIGTVKIPNLIRKKTNKNIIFEKISGHDLPEDLSRYKLIIHCGACMTNRKEVLSRILLANKANVPITNYGIAISYCLGILDRATKIFFN